MAEDYTKCPLCGDAWLQHRDDWDIGCGHILAGADIGRSRELKTALSHAQTAVERGQYATAAHAYADAARMFEEQAFWFPHWEASRTEFMRREELRNRENPDA